MFYDPHTWAVQETLPTPDCAGIDHADFTADGRTAVFTCEFAGRVAVVDVATHRLLRMIDMPRRNTRMGPQDIKLAPDGSVFYIADSDQNGLWVLDGAATKVVREIPTGMGAHGLYLSRDATKLYVTNRQEGSVSVLDAYTGAPLAKWTIPGGGSPDMGNVTADGTQLWLSGRYDRSVYVLSTADGHLIHKSRWATGPTASASGRSRAATRWGTPASPGSPTRHVGGASRCRRTPTGQVARAVDRCTPVGPLGSRRGLGPPSRPA